LLNDEVCISQKYLGTKPLPNANFIVQQRQQEVLTMSRISTIDDEDSEPAWLDTGYDKSHREDVKPLLFGTGKISLNDPTDEVDDNMDLGGGYQNQGQHQQKKQNDNDTIGFESPTKSKSYGSTYHSPNRSSLWTIPTTSTNNPTSNSDDDNGNNSNLKMKNQHQDHSKFDASSVKITYHKTSGVPNRPKREWPVKVFFVIEACALLTCLTLLVSQLLPIVFVPISDFDDRAYLALKIYMCIFSIIFMIVEIDQPSIPFLKNAVFSTTYATRGFVYTFFGLICFEEAYSEKAHKMLEKAESSSSILTVSWFATSNRLAAFSLLSMGILYFLMGICCLQTIRNQFIYGDRATWKAYRNARDAFLNS